MIDAAAIIVAELDTLLAANPPVEIRDGAGVIIARNVDASVRRKAISDCIAVAKKICRDGGAVAALGPY